MGILTSSLASPFSELGYLPISDIVNLPVDFSHVAMLPLKANEETMDLCIKAIRCQRCGKCCYETNNEGVWLRGNETQIVSSFLKIRPRHFIRTYTHLIQGLPHINIPCPFYQKEKSNCKIYPVRPISCAKYPVVMIPIDNIPTVGIRCCPAGIEFIKIFLPELNKAIAKGKENL